MAMAMATRALVLISLSAACATGSATPKPRVAESKRILRPISGTYDTVTVTRGTDVLRVHVLTADRCEELIQTGNTYTRVKGRGAMTETRHLSGTVPAGPSQQEAEYAVPCDMSKPAAGVEVVLNAAEHRDYLGTTSPEGELEVPLPRIDALFRQRPVNHSQRAQLLVHGNVVADLPLGEILNRQSVIDSTIADCDRMLAEPSVGQDVFQRLVGTLLDLQIRGIADPRIADRMQKLSDRLHSVDSKTAVEQEELGHAQELLTQLKADGTEQAVPAAVQQNVSDKHVEGHSFQWALSLLPTMCKITVKGGGVAVGQLIATGAPGIALAIIAASVGDDLSKWLIQRCCKLATESIGGSSSCTEDTNQAASKSVASESN